MLSISLTVLALASPPPAAVCRSAAHCAFVAREALLDGQLDTAERAAAMQLHFAECGAPERAGAALDTLARIALQRRQPLLARAWLSVPQEGPPPSTDTARSVADAVARLAAGDSLGGEYQSYQRAAQWNTLSMTPVAPDRVRFSLDASRLSSRWCDDLQGVARGDLSYLVATLGHMEGVATRQGDVFVYETHEFLGEDTAPCTMRFRFGKDAVTVEQDGLDTACGFGGGVNASGEYVRTRR